MAFKNDASPPKNFEIFSLLTKNEHRTAPHVQESTADYLLWLLVNAHTSGFPSARLAWFKVRLYEGKDPRFENAFPVKFDLKLICFVYYNWDTSSSVMLL